MLGDRISAGLDLLGVTPGRVEAWLGRPCGCEDRRQKLNQLEVWGRGLAKRSIEASREILERFLSD